MYETMTPVLASMGRIEWSRRRSARFLKAPITKTLPIESPRAAGLIRLPGGRQLPILPSA